LPAPIPALDAWDAMLATARRIGEILQADMLDEERSPFTRQREAQTREEMREYDRKKSTVR
ncbi:MAG: cell division protein ZipA C-terminal FtsZ-binding domain-containing protein, partial [Xanthomonadales bacterium]|nr:cell division protein ZipA C-terminal FtsZ-binding domain-containing protein [Xanthomonadales bacterium]